MKNILFGKIKVKVGKDLHVVENAVWTEGESIYKGREKKYKEPALIIKVIESKIVGHVNKKKFQLII